MTNESKRKVKFFTSGNIESLGNMYMDWRNEKDNVVSNVIEQFSVDGDVYHITVFFDKEIE